MDDTIFAKHNVSCPKSHAQSPELVISAIRCTVIDGHLAKYSTAMVLPNLMCYVLRSILLCGLNVNQALALIMYIYVIKLLIMLILIIFV